MKNKIKILITGGSGFIGSSIVKKLLKKNILLLNIDCLNYASNKKNLKEVEKNPNYKFLKMDISQKSKLKKIITKYSPNYIINCAAETHVVNSIVSSKQFINSNIIGTYNLLECTKDLCKKKKFKLFHQISTDEVFGDSFKTKYPPKENSEYRPSSPYSASKASADHLVVAWGRTYKIPYSISICTNNYGPRQYPEKLIPKTIINALDGKKIPIYGNGKQIRDWLYVDDHADAVEKILFNKKSNGNKFNVSGDNQISNLKLVITICNYLNKKITNKPKQISKFEDLIMFVNDRPGHDKKYFLNSKKIRKKINWKPKFHINAGLKSTIDWYLINKNWWKKKNN